MFRRRVLRIVVVVLGVVALGALAAPSGAATALTVSGFTPTQGSVGTTVTISGTGFTGVSTVKFNGTSASFSVLSPTEISATVPIGASTGKISVKRQSATRSSATAFVVTTPPQPSGAPWPTYQHDYRHTGKASVNGPSGSAVTSKWVYKSVSWIKNQVTVAADDTVYIGDSRFPVCSLAPGAGTRNWCTRVGGYVNQSAATIGNPYQKTDEKGTRTVDTLYIGERNNIFWAIDTEGTVLWNYKINFDGDVRQTAVIGPDRTVYMMCGCTGKGLLHAFTPDGQLKWTLDLPQVRDASPALTTVGGRTRLYVPSNNGDLAAVDDLGSSGLVVWSERLALANLHSSPSVGDDGTIYMGTNEGVLALRDNGTSVSTIPGWPVSTNGEVDTAPAISGGQLFVSAIAGGTRTVYAIDIAGARTLWSVAGPGSSSASFALTPSPVIGGNGWVYAAIGDDVYAFDPASASPSTPKWSFVTTGDVIALSIGDGVLYANTRKNKLYALTSS